MRFPNHEVLSNLGVVVQLIQQEVEQRRPPTRSSSRARTLPLLALPTRGR
jgi:hypothetical protein